MKCENKDGVFVLKDAMSNTVLAVFLIVSPFVFYIFFFMHLEDPLPSSKLGGVMLTVIFSALFSVLLIVIGILMFYKSAGYKIIMDSWGIREERRFGAKSCRSYTWDEICDWGYSFVVQSSSRGITLSPIYYVYFSDHPLSQVNFRSKAVTKHCVIIQCYEKEIKEKVIPYVIPFCQKRTEVKPFAPKL